MFNKKKKEIQASDLSTAIDNLTSQFANMIKVLKDTSEQALSEKAVKEQKIVSLKVECSNLEDVSNRALQMSDKIANIFS